MSQLLKPISRTTYPTRRSEQLKQLLADTETFATSLFLVAADEFGSEFLTHVDESGETIPAWSPSTIKMELEQTFNVDIPEVNQDKLFAAMLLVESDSFYQDLPQFISIVNALADNNGATKEAFNLATVPECAWAVTEAQIICPASVPPESEQGLFSPDIRAYLEAILKKTGYQISPQCFRHFGIVLDVADSLPAMDDPEFYAAVYSVQKDRADALDMMVEELKNDLLLQLSSLPLKSADASRAPQAIAKRLSS